MMVVVLGALLLTGCPPPPLSLDEPDAGVNTAPSITSVRKDDATELTIGIPNDLIRTLATMTVTIVDPDLEDTLYVRGFFDYTEAEGSQTPARAVCNVGPSDPRTLSRQATCNLGAFCHMDEMNSNHQMDVVVSDRVPDDEGVVLPRRYLDVKPPGRQDRRTYTIRCQEPPPS